MADTLVNLIAISAIGAEESITVTSLTLIRLEVLVLQIFETKRTEFPLKLDQNPDLKPYK